jgi:CubicO group peptidase (beta-lactamase class C family)
MRARLLVCLSVSAGCGLALISSVAGGEPSGSVAAGMAFPGAHWEEATPASQRLSASKLEEAVAFLKGRTGRDGVRELVIVRNGRLVWKGDNVDRRHGVWSCTKSITSTVLGRLVDEGKCSLDSLAARWVPELAADYPAVTLRHFTTMTSGYRARGDEPQGSYKHGPSNTPFLPSPEPLFVPPGSQYAYWDSAMNMFGLVLTRAAGRPMEEIFRERVATPLGMTNWHWGSDSTKGLVINGGSGNRDKQIYVSARDLARFGLLYLNRGNWNGRQILSPRWVEQATRLHVAADLPWAHPESSIDGRGCYGLNWWVNGVLPSGKRKWPGAPAGTFAAVGHNNNRCFVVPEWQMVIVRLGLDQGDGALSDETISEFFSLVGRAML